MAWLALVTALAGLAKEIFRYARESDEHDSTCATKITEATNAVREARKTKNTLNIELALGGKSPAPAGMHDKQN